MLISEIWLWVFELSFDDVVVIVHVLVLCVFFPPQNCEGLSNYPCGHMELLRKMCASDPPGLLPRLTSFLTCLSL